MGISNYHSTSIGPHQIILIMHAKGTIKALILACAAYLVYTLFAKIYTLRRNAAKARELECEEPRIQRNKLPLGIDQLRRALKADKNLQFPVDTTQRFRDVGAFTFRASILGNTTIFTADEKNIQAILATQFNDFDIGPVWLANLPTTGKQYHHPRRQSMAAFLSHDAAAICSRTSL
jgi:hypothetical protein